MVIWYDKFAGRIQILPREQDPGDDRYHRRGEADNLIAAVNFVKSNFTVLVQNYNTFWVDEAEDYESVAED